MMAEPTPSDADRDPHFIGWLPVPRAYARFLVPVVAGLLVATAVAAGLIARGQRSPGDGRWDDDRTTTFEGVAYAEPYAMVRVPGAGGDGTVATVLLVEEGKFGAKGRMHPLDGQPVRVTGTLLYRDGVRMLELAAGDDGLRPAPLSSASADLLRRSPPQFLGRVTVRGEIVDSKCYLGAMKPGGGRTHKGCAALCLKGGVPPLLVTRDAAGGTACYLLASATGGPLGQEVLDLVGEQVELDGVLESWGDIAVLKTAGGSFCRR
jgi:hypothetical protein